MMDDGGARLTAKLALEAELARPLTQVLGAYVSTWETTEGNVPMMQHIAYQEALRRALERHYARVVSAMLGEMPTAGTTLDAAKIDMEHGERLRLRAHERAGYMISAIERDLTAILTATIANEAVNFTWAKAAGVDLEAKADKPKKPSALTGFGSRFQTSAARAYFKLRQKLRALVNAETEETAEEAMFEWIKKRRNHAAVVKIWITVGDERVRHSHVDAGDRYGTSGPIPVDQPFRLAGGNLMFPGDSSMGAGLKEIINCRCSAHYYALSADGLTPLGLSTPVLPTRRPWRPGDKFGEEIPIRATETVTLNGSTRARVVLGDNHTQATLSQPSASVINVSIDGQVVARAVHDRGAVTSITIAPGRDSLDITRLIRDSVAHSWARKPRE